jgi:flavodoxin
LNSNHPTDKLNGENMPIKTALMIYHSSTGNTEKVAQAICLGLEEAGVYVEVKKPQFAVSVDYFKYDFVCIGSPSIYWRPAPCLDDFLKNKFEEFKKQGKIKPSAPKVPGKNALIFCTYSGPHTGVEEAIPAGKYMAQFFDHIGFTIIAEWYILCEFHGSIENSTLGKMGDIRGKPTVDDLMKIKENAKALAQKYSAL